MKTLRIWFVLMLAIPFFTLGQFKPGDALCSAGISFSQYGNYSHKWDSESNFDKSGILPIWVQYESGLPDTWDLGDETPNFTLGAFLGFSKMDYEKVVSYAGNDPYRVFKNYGYLTFGGVFSYHYTPLLGEIDITLDPKKFDLYVSVKAGLVFSRFKSNYDDNPLDPNVPLGMIDNSSSKSYLALAPQLGCRYYFHPRWAAMAEIGYFNMSLVSLGVSYRLK